MGIIVLIYTFYSFSFTKYYNRATIWIKPKISITTNSVDAYPNKSLNILLKEAKAKSLNEKSAEKKISLRINKGKYLLYFLYGSDTLKTYPVVLGFDPVNDKLQEGDGCTPEGIFKVKAKYPHRSWSKFIWIDYPTQDSWKKFNAAKKNGRLSNQSTIGGQIGIHGTPPGKDFMIDDKINWTLGCISLKNEHIDEIYAHISVGTPILIRR